MQLKKRGPVYGAVIEGGVYGAISRVRVPLFSANVKR